MTFYRVYAYGQPDYQVAKFKEALKHARQFKVWDIFRSDGVVIAQSRER